MFTNIKFNICWPYFMNFLRVLEKNRIILLHSVLFNFKHNWLDFTLNLSHINVVLLQFSLMIYYNKFFCYYFSSVVLWDHGLILQQQNTNLACVWLGQEFTDAHTTPSSLSITPESPAEDYDDGGEEEYEEYPDPNTNNFQATK